MRSVLEVIVAIASELTVSAKSHFPELRSGETILHEGLENGIFFRETQLDGVQYRFEFDFTQRNYKQLIM